jgi:NADPH:quinone reductase-like Zn-dependent oxidoreductase
MLIIFQIGDRVIAFKDYGSWSELVTVNAQYLYKMPTSMSFQDGAALPMNYLTGYMMLFEIGNLRKGQSVLVHSVGGGVVS